MATRFARVDLSDISRDFRPIAVEPGVALLDKSHANATILFRWLGRFLAEPDWDEDSVNFFVRDEKGGRLEDVACQPATPESLKGPMKEELEALTERIEKIKPETPTERKIFRVLLDNFMAVTGNPDRTDSDSYFFRYKDVEGVWRLSWCWGYERIDQQPAPAVVCNHAECNLLFVKRPGWSQKCPCCEKTVTIGPSKKRMVLAAQRRRRLLTALLLLLLIFCLIWFFYPKKLIATPKEWSGTVGERIAFRIERKGLFTSTDVTDEVDVELQDSEILGFDEEDRVIVAKAPGTTYVNFRLGKLVSEDVDCTVEGTLIVSPKELDMVTGEITDLSIESPSSEPIRITSSDPAVVEITPANRLIARSEGKAEITVAQAQWTKTVQATVSTADIQSIAIDPAEVEVPVDGSAEVKVMGQTPERLVELAPDLLECQTLPSTEFATFDPAKMTFQGIAPTGETKQTLGMAFGDRQATASVEVVEVVPEQLEMTPAGPISLPLGQAAPLQVWATYEDGRRIGVLPHRVSWHTDPEAEIAAEAGLELRDGMVMAMNQPAGPLTVWAAYLGKETNRVEVTAVERGDVTLRLEVDRTIRLAGEPGQVFLAGSGPHGDVQLIPGIGQFKSSDESVLKIDEKTGAFLALTPGPVTLTATHLASDKEATLDLTVHDPANAKLIFQPELVRVGIDEIAEMQLLLSVIDGAETRTAPMDGPGVQYATAQPDAIRWQPPRVIGSQATAPFEVSAVYQPLVGKTAVGRIEVVDTEAPESIRVVPPTLSLAPGQSVSLRLQEKIPGDDTWHEVTTGAIHWEVPPELKWTPATGTLRPAVSVSPAASGEFALQASYRGKQAQCAVTAKSEGPDPNADGATLKLVRQPVGTYLPAGQQQRYTVLVDDGSTDDGTTDDGSKQEPAANVRWPADFENEFVRWQAPVLTAKQPGYIQQLRADAGNKTLLFRTITTEPLQYGNTPAAPSEQPIAVRIIGRDGQDAVFPVGADFNAFHIEAEYASGFKRRVTRKATMLIGGNPQAARVAAANGRLRGIRPGNTDVHAEFQGVRSTEALNVNVTGELIVDEIRVTPSPMRMMPGETVSLQVTGYQDGKSVGLITGMPGVSLQAGGDGAVSVAGSELTAMRLGSGTVKAQIAGRPGVRSVAADVQVVDSIADVLEIDQPLIRMHQGES
ncbi:MAG: hypothetical protein HQ581_01850, partial [Planctomycetes bacterium]|nr:hypothetical protein [Planctomycetota bacterium]